MTKTALLASALAGAVLSAATPAVATSFVTSGTPMMTANSGWVYSPLLTVGDTLDNGYQPVGLFDGIGAYQLNRSTVRILVNHELSVGKGRIYSVDDGSGGLVNLTGARISFFDIDTASRGIVDGGLAYSKIFDRGGAIVSNAAQVDGGFSRFCSSAAFEPNTFGGGSGIVDRIYFTGSETSNGSMYALNTATNELHAAPQLGRGAWENATQLDTGTTNKVAFVMSDDTSGSNSDYGSPMYLYVGEKGAKGDGSFLDRNGLAEGKLYVWVSDAGKTNPTDFNGNGTTSAGHWAEIENFNAAKAGTAGYDALGYADQQTLRDEAAAAGAFRFSRPEDVATQPGDGTVFALNSTGSNRLSNADQWGTIYTFDLEFDADGNPIAGTVKVIYDGNDDPTHAVRSMDNLTWAGDGALLVQEDQATNWAGEGETKEAQIVKVLLDGTVVPVTEMDRTALQGFIDSKAGQLGAWESSGILDVSALFGAAAGTLFIGDVQAHGLGTVNNADLYENGQLFFLSSVPEPSTWVGMVAGFAMLGGMMRRRRTVSSVRFA